MSQEELRARVEAALDKVRPFLAAHGGGVDLAGIDADGTVRVRLSGACAGCPLAGLTLAAGVERAIMESVPEVKRVIATPHVER